MKGVKNYVALAVGMAVFLGVLYSLGPHDVWLALKDARYGYVGLTLGLFLAASYLRMYKWVLMRDRMRASIPFREITVAYFSSKFWGMFSPMRSGEVAPALAGGAGSGRLGRLLSIILYDRIIETFQTLIVFSALFFLFYGVFFKVQAGVILAGIFVILTLFTLVLVTKEAGERIFGWADSLLALIGGWSLAVKLKGFLDHIKGEMEEFYAAIRSYFTPWFSLYNLLITFACWGLDMLFWVALFKAMRIDTSLLVTVASVMVYSMMATLTPVPSGLGVADLSFALVLSRFGWSGQAGGLIIVSRVLMTGYVFLGYFMSRALAESARSAP